MSESHRLSPMRGRDPHESRRAATPLELLFDLTFVIAFSQVSTQTAMSLERADLATAGLGFGLAIFAATWAWISYSWLASAYDNDDVFFRIATLVQMVGVLVLALGVPPLFRSLAEGEHLDTTVIIAGYVIMRVSAVALWLRAAHDDPPRRATCLAYARNIGLTQLGWIALLVADPPLWASFAVAGVLVAIELAGPFWADRRHGPTPWHAEHIAERYGLLAIIALGEVVLGTVLTISAGVEESRWTLEAAVLAFGGTALAFALWWMYFAIPFGALLNANRRRAFSYGYLHYFVFAAIVAIGAGLHVAAQVLAHAAHVDTVFATLCVAVPVLAFELMLFVLSALMVGSLDAFHVWLFLGGAAVLAVAVVAAGAGAGLGVALLVVACSPTVTVVGYETVGWRHGERLLARLRED